MCSLSSLALCVRRTSSRMQSGIGNLHLRKEERFSISSTISSDSYGNSSSNSEDILLNQIRRLPYLILEEAVSKVSLCQMFTNRAFDLESEEKEDDMLPDTLERDDPFKNDLQSPEMLQECPAFVVGENITGSSQMINSAPDYQLPLQPLIPGQQRRYRQDFGLNREYVQARERMQRSQPVQVGSTLGMDGQRQRMVSLRQVAPRTVLDPSQRTQMHGS